MPTTSAVMRKERIERLLRELEYELTRGVMESEIEEEMHWQHVLPWSRAIPNGVIAMEFRMRPVTQYSLPLSFGQQPPRLKLVGEQ